MDTKPYAAYRKSGVRGLDVLPEHWEEERAKHYFQPIDERSESGEEQLLSVSENRGIEPRDDEKVHTRKAESYEGYKLCRPGDLVINSMWAWKRGLGVSEHAGIISTAYSVFRLRGPLLFEEKYLDWLLRTNLYVGEYLCRSQGVWKSRLTLSDREFLDIPVIRPPIDDQRAIVDHLEDRLDDIDDYVAKKRELVDLLKTQRRAVVNRAVTTGLDEDVAMQDSGVEWLGEIPTHWDVTRLSYLTPTSRQIMYGIVLAGPDVEDGGVPLIKGGDVKANRLKPKLLSQTSKEIDEKHANSRVRAGDIVYSIRGGIGDVAIVPEELEGANLTQDVARVSPIAKVDGRWLFYALQSNFFREQMTAQALGAAVRGINIRDLKRGRVPVPPQSEQKDIADFLDRKVSDIDAAIERTERQIDLMQQYRTSLVTEVVTGAVDVREEVAA